MRITSGRDMRMRPLYDATAQRRAVNLSLNSDMVARARAERLNLSSIAEEAIGKALAEAARKRFLEEIAIGVAEHAAFLAEYGSLSEAVQAQLEDGDS